MLFPISFGSASLVFYGNFTICDGNSTICDSLEKQSGQKMRKQICFKLKCCNKMIEYGVFIQCYGHIKFNRHCFVIVHCFYE